jgi:hypothetical protein
MEQQTDRQCACVHACTRVCPLHGRTNKEIRGARQGYQTHETRHMPLHQGRRSNRALFSFCHARPIAHIVRPTGHT